MMEDIWDYGEETTPPPYDVYAHHGRLLMERLTFPSIPELPRQPKDFASIYSGTSDVLPISTKDGEPTIGIVGAGVAGLYAAMMLQSLDISYEILEASERTGGRLFTHKFSEADGDYFDVGAMRFPRTVIMERLFKLFESQQLNPPNDPILKRLIPYHLDAIKSNSFLLYNGRRFRQNKIGPSAEDPLGFKELGVPQEDLNDGSNYLLRNAIDPYIIALKKDLQTTPPSQAGWRKMMREVDNSSARGHMTNTLRYSPDTVNWIETLGGSTGSYGRSMSDIVLGAMSFGAGFDEPGKSIEWHCLRGGAQVLSDSMARYILENAPASIKFKKFVTGLSTAKTSGISKGIQVSIENEPDRVYQHVISTLPLPALRLLRYAPSIKIGIKFKSTWWTEWVNLDGEKLDIEGGQSKTDRVVRTVVYPSYGPTTVLIVSYTLMDDASSLGALIGAGKEVEERLKRLVLRDLEDIHHLEHGKLLSECVDFFAWDWQNSPLTQGAFAFFGPGNYSTVYDSMTLPNRTGTLHFAGEALSTRHGWVVGALNSAWRAVHAVLIYSFHDKLPAFYKMWGKDEEWVSAEPSRHYQFPLDEEVPYDADKNLLFWHLYKADKRFAHAGL